MNGFDRGVSTHYSPHVMIHSSPISSLLPFQSVYSVPVYGGPLSNASGASNANGNPGALNTKTIADFQQFITEFREDEAFIYRDRLRANCLRKEWTLEVEMTHLIGWREDLASRCRSEPGEVVPLVSSILL
jgi:DNA replication licensing factor MCM5